MATVEQPTRLLEVAVTRWAALDRGWQAIAVAALVTIGASIGLQIPW